MADPTEDTEKIRRGQRAALVLSSCDGAIRDMTEHILTRLVALHTSDTLTDTALRGMIGEIAGLRTLMKTLEGERRRGREISERMNG